MLAVRHYFNVFYASEESVNRATTEVLPDLEAFALNFPFWFFMYNLNISRTGKVSKTWSGVLQRKDLCCFTACAVAITEDLWPGRPLRWCWWFFNWGPTNKRERKVDPIRMDLTNCHDNLRLKTRTLATSLSDMQTLMRFRRLAAKRKCLIKVSTLSEGSWDVFQKSDWNLDHRESETKVYQWWGDSQVSGEIKDSGIQCWQLVSMDSRTVALADFKAQS